MIALLFIFAALFYSMITIILLETSKDEEEK